MTTTSALSPTHDALAAAITGDGTLAAMLASDKVYSLTAPIGAVPDYIVLATAGSSGIFLFGRNGEAMNVSLSVWTAGEDGRRALAIYGELYRLLHMKPLAVSGHRFLYGALGLVLVTPDPGGDMAHLVAIYRPSTLSN